MLYVDVYISWVKTMVGFVSQEGDLNVDCLVQWSCPHIDTETDEQLNATYVTAELTFPSFYCND